MRNLVVVLTAALLIRSVPAHAQEEVPELAAPKSVLDAAKDDSSRGPRRALSQSDREKALKDEEERKKAEAEARRKAEEERKRAEAEAKVKAAEEAKFKAVEEARLKAEAEAAERLQQAEAEKKRVAEEKKRATEDGKKRGAGEKKLSAKEKKLAEEKARQEEEAERTRKEAEALEAKKLEEQKKPERRAIKPGQAVPAAAIIPASSQQEAQQDPRFKALAVVEDAEVKVTSVTGGFTYFGILDSGCAAGKVFVSAELLSSFDGLPAGTPVVLRLEGARSEPARAGESLVLSGLRRAGKGRDGTFVYCGR